MRHFYIKTFILLLMSLLLSIPLSAQLLISQIVGNNGYTVDRPNAIEIFNYSGTQLVLNSNNFSVTTHRKNYSGNKTVYTWIPDGDIVLEPSMNFVLIGFRFSQPNGVDPDLTAFLSASGAQFYDTSADSLTFDETSSIRLNLNGVIVDQIGQWGLSNANIIPNDTTPNTINQRNWERKLDWITTGNPSWTRENRGGQGGIETGGFLNTFTQLNSALAPYTVDDALGLGVSPGTIVYDGSNWNTPGNSQGTIPSNTNGSVIEIGSGSIALDNNQNNINKIVVADSATVTLGANASGYSQAKRISKKGSNQTGTIISERYFGNDGWHIIGTPFANGFANTQGRGVSARYWYWNGGGWTEAKLQLYLMAWLLW